MVDTKPSGFGQITVIADKDDSFFPHTQALSVTPLDKTISYEDFLSSISILTTVTSINSGSADVLLVRQNSDSTAKDITIDNLFKTRLLDSPSINYAINAQTGTTYTLVLLDAGKIVTSSNAATVVVTIPPNSSVAFPIGSSITVVSIGAGLTNFAIGSGVTINSTGAVPAAPVLRAQYSSATAIKTATDTWVVVGDIT